MGENRVTDKSYLVNTDFKTSDDYMEACFGELITTELQPVPISELLQELVLEPAVEMAVNRQLHIAIASRAGAETLSTLIAEFARADNAR